MTRALLLLLSLTFGCGDDAAPPPDGGRPDAGEVDASVVDAGAADAGVSPLPDPPPVAPFVELAPVVIDRWLVRPAVNPGFPDPLGDEIERGTLELPDEGDGWRAVVPGAEGAIETLASRTFWAVTSVDAADDGGLVARVDTVERIHRGVTQQPGDLYHARSKRVPVLVRAGQNVISVRAVGFRRDPEVALWRTTDELWMNAADATAPDLRAGDADEQWLGVPILNLTDRPALRAIARVVDSEHFEETTVEHASLGPGATTQVAFRLVPKAAWEAPPEEDAAPIPVVLRIESHAMGWSYERELELGRVASDVPWRRTFRSAIDGSVQYYGVRPPADLDPARDYGVVLALHGAGVQGIGHARAYSSKDWAFVIAPTNRRPFGFDWEAWGRLDAMEVLDRALASFRTDPTRVWVTGHSMGGHGTWQLGVLFPGRFAVVAPSAGWSSFYSYVGRERPGGAFARSMASSDTNAYVGNLARRGVFIVHGDADDNVPVREGRDMYALVRDVAEEVGYHEQPGAGHWWDGDAAPGVDCVDWPGITDMMQARTLDPLELDFDFVTPAPWVSARHGYVTIRSVLDPWRDARIVGAGATLSTDNVRSLSLDGAGLRSRGVESITVDGAAHDVPDGPLTLGPETGKTELVHGPIGQVFHRPFVLVWDDEGPEFYRAYAAFLLSSFQYVGNGQGMAMPLSELHDRLRARYRVVYVGVPRERAFEGVELPFDWSPSRVVVGDDAYEGAALAFVFPEGGDLSAAFVATEGREHLLFGLQPFTSGFALPDWYVWGPEGGIAAGFVDSDWSAIAPAP